MNTCDPLCYTLTFFAGVHPVVGISANVNADLMHVVCYRIREVIKQYCFNLLESTEHTITGLETFKNVWEPHTRTMALVLHQLEEIL